MQGQDEKGALERTTDTGRITILELMTVLAVLGILLTWVLRKFFLS